MVSDTLYFYLTDKCKKWRRFNVSKGIDGKRKHLHSFFLHKTFSCCIRVMSPAPVNPLDQVAKVLQPNATVSLADKVSTLQTFNSTLEGKRLYSDPLTFN